MTLSPQEPLPPFPAGKGGNVCLPAGDAARGLRLNAATDADLPWLRALYASTRADELGGVPWPEGVKRAFLDDQFALQHRHYLTHFAAAEFMVVESSQGPLGRLYLMRTLPEHLLVDISLFPPCRGSGLGTMLLQAAQQDAALSGRDLCLHAQTSNESAQRFYRRLGFLPEGDASTGHQYLRWRRPVS